MRWAPAPPRVRAAVFCAQQRHSLICFPCAAAPAAAVRLACCRLAFFSIPRLPSSPPAVAELEAALAARDTQLAAAQEAQRSSIALLSTRGRSTVGEVCGGRLNA